MFRGNIFDYYQYRECDFFYKRKNYIRIPQLTLSPPPTIRQCTHNL